MGLFSWIILGLIAGALARWIMPGRQKSGCILTMLLGIGGGVVGGWIGSMLGWGTVSEFNLSSLGLAVLGAVVILGIHRAITGRSGGG